jgi:hypothetical protein
MATKTKPKNNNKYAQQAICKQKNTEKYLFLQELVNLWHSKSIATFTSHFSTTA